MPRKSPDVIYVHRIEAGVWERDNILKPVVEMQETLSQIKTGVKVLTGVAIAGGIMGAWVIAKKIADIPEAAWDMVTGWWDKTILSSKNREDFRRDVEEAGPIYPDLDDTAGWKERNSRIWDFLTNPTFGF